MTIRMTKVGVMLALGFIVFGCTPKQAQNALGRVVAGWKRRTGKFMGGPTRSDAQTESAFPDALFAEYLLGHSVTKLGMKEVTITCPDTGNT